MKDCDVLKALLDEQKKTNKLLEKLLNNVKHHNERLYYCDYSKLGICNNEDCSYYRCKCIVENTNDTSNCMYYRGLINEKELFK